MTQIASHGGLEARRLANMIGMVKIVLISLIVLGCALSLADSGALGRVLTVLVGSAAAACVHVVFGWLEHSLLLLVDIAHNTAVGPRSVSGVEE